MDFIFSILNLSFIAQVLRLFTPYYLGASAANFSERGGVINIAIEGFMIISAFMYAMFAIYLNNSIASAIFTIIFALLFALFFAFFTVKLKLNQIVIGVGFNLLFAGLSNFLLIFLFHSSSNTPRFVSLPKLPIISEIKLVGNVFGDFIILFSFLLVFLSNEILFKTKFGLRLRSAGENPEAGESLGVRIRLYKLYGILISGFLSALGGIWIASSQNTYSQGMVAGRGFIALAAMIIGKWKPTNIFFVCLMFSFFESLEITLQITQSFIPSQIIQMLPYLITILVLIGIIGKTKAPSSDGIPY
ncbi:MAG: ABC transporter permease [Ignavibacteria bacterium]|nr:ABC transporter permease [Ignavibacteria bacterium]